MLDTSPGRVNQLPAVADPSSIYVRTPRGQALVLQPTQVVQRNLRIALMLVNGQHTTRDIVEQFGDPMVANAALQDLLRSGLIRLKDAGPVGAPHGTSSATAAQHSLPPQRTEVPVGSAARAVVEAAGSSVRAAAERGHPEGSSRRRLNDRPRDAAEFATQRNRAIGRSENRRFAWSWRRASILAVLSALIAAAGTVLLYPYDRHRPQAEAVLTRLLGHPVKVGRIGLALSPKPGLMIEQVAAADGARLAVAAVRILPDPRFLFDGNLLLHEVALSRPEADAGALAELLRRLAAGGAEVGFTIRNLRFSDGTVRVDDADLDGFSGSASFERNGTLKLVRFDSADGTLHGELAPDELGIAVKLSATGWSPSLIRGASLDHFDGQGRITADSLRFDSMEARLAEGLLKGQFSLNWNGGARADARLEMSHVSAGKLLAQARPGGLPLQGAITGAVRVVAQADRISRLKDNFALEGDVTVARGTLERLDLVEAVRTAGTSRVRGGTTRFEELSARIRIDGQTTKLSGVRIQSGLLRADGQLAIGANQKVSGTVVVELRGSYGQVRMPLSITGTVSEPLLQSHASPDSGSGPGIA